METCQVFGLQIHSRLCTFPSMLIFVVGCLDGMRPTVVAGKKGNEITKKKIGQYSGAILVNTVVIHVDPDEPEFWTLSYNIYLPESVENSFGRMTIRDDLRGIYMRFQCR